MLEKIIITNFLSFKSATEFTFEATDDTTLEEQLVRVMPDGKRLLRLSLLYGANAAGKSNFLQILRYIRLFTSAHSGAGKGTGRIPFLLDRDMPLQPSSLELYFYAEGHRYRYFLEVDESIVLREELYIYLAGSEELVAKRWDEKGLAKLKAEVPDLELHMWSIRCLPNISFFVPRREINISIPHFDAAMHWFEKNLLPVLDGNLNLRHLVEWVRDVNPSFLDQLMGLMKRADFNISGYTDKLWSDDGSSLQLAFSHRVRTERGVEIYPLESDLESKGTLRLVGLEGTMALASKGALLPIDEIESSLHPELLELVIVRFLGDAESRAQLLLTTHYDVLLNAVGDYLRQDTVWFAEKGEDGATQFFSLADFDGVEDLSSIWKAYRNGRMGGLPSIS